MPGAVLALEVDLVQSTGKLVPIETGRCAFTGLLNFYAFWGKKLFGIKKILLEENFRRSFTCFIHLTLILSIIRMSIKEGWWNIRNYYLRVISIGNAVYWHYYPYVCLTISHAEIT